MPIKFSCPHCKQVLSVKDELAGRKGPCPKCKNMVSVPAAGAAPAPAAAPAPPKSPTDTKPTAPLSDWLAEQGKEASTGSPRVVKPAAAKPAPAGKPAADKKAAVPPPDPSHPPLPRREGIQTTTPPADTTAPAPPVDVDAEAAALFSEGENNGPVEAPTTVDFTCPYCDTELHLPADLAGKKSPCPNPECRRIIKVPELTKTEKKDWRQANKIGPSLAKPTTEPAPEGAWSSTERTLASGQALREAGVIAARVKPRTLTQKLFKPVLAATVLLVVGGGGWWWYSAWAAGREMRALQAALDYARSDAGRPQAGMAGQATLLAGAGDYFLRTGKSVTEGGFLQKANPGCGILARNHYGQALALLSQAPADSERDAALAELAEAEAELGGTGEDVQNELRIPWDEIQKRVRSTLSAMRPGGRLEALRAVARRFIAHGQPDRVLPLAGQVYPSPEEDKAEAVAAVGLEFLAAGDKDRATRAAEQALAPYAKGPPPKRPEEAKKPPPIRPAVVALAMTLNGKPPAPGRGPDEEMEHLIGETEGLARLGQWDDAKQKAANRRFGPNAQFRAHVGLAAAAVDAKSAEAVAAVEAALNFFHAEVRNRRPLAWDVYRLAALAQRAGVSEERLRALAEDNPDPALRGRTQLAAFRMQLARSKEAAEDGAAEQAVGPSVAQLLAFQALARHNTRRDADWAKGVASWEEPRRAFGSLGIALGLQDRRLGEQH
jgi:hypothetical protein